jgi:uncharacterized protein YbaR (Trm112 family)
MPSDSKELPAFDPEVLDQLACPVCLGALRFVEEQLNCTACGRIYLIVGGIPVLIAGRAEEIKPSK